MRFVIYKNSVLATFCSIFGAAFIVMAVTSMVSGELGILPGIGVIAAGLGFMWLGDIISTKKAQRKRKKAQQAAAAAASSPTASYAQPQQSAPVASYAASAVQDKPVNKSAVFAGIFFLLATLLGVWSAFSYDNNFIDRLAVVECAGFLLLAIGCFRMKRMQRANAFHLIGALLPMVVCAYSIFNFLKWAIFPYWSHGMHLTFSWYMRTLAGNMNFVSMALVFLAFLLLALFAFCARKPKGRGGVTGALWFLPSVLLAAYLVILFEYDSGLNQLLNSFVEKPRWMPHHLMLTLFRDIHVIVACFLAGLCFRRICRSPAVVPQMNTPYVQPQSAPPVQPVQPQPEPRYAAPEPPKQPEPAPKANNQDVEKQIQAYRDLLDCGILSQEECEQKVRELTQKYYRG